MLLGFFADFDEVPFDVADFKELPVAKKRGQRAPG